MKPIEEKGLEELKSLKSRCSRLFGLGRMSKEAFDRRIKKIIDLEEDLKRDDDKPNKE